MSEVTQTKTDPQPTATPGAVETSGGGGVALCVDLDGSLLRSDLLWESLFQLLGEEPARALSLPSGIAGGKANLKHRIAERVELDAATLPYHEEVLAFLREQKEAGRTLVLATASHQKYADAVAEHLGLFDHVIGSDATHNRRGAAKIAAIREAVGETFDYVGDSDADLPLVAACRKLYLVDPSRGLREAGEKAGNVERTFEKPAKARGFRPLVKLARPHQWAKNALIFVPMLMGQAVTLTNLLIVLLGFAAFSAAASSIYIFNDLVDIESDRRHATKRRRPLAAATVAVPTALKLGLGLLGLGLLLAAFGGLAFLGWVVLYLVLTTAYSFSLKRRLLVDVILLGWLYTHRVIAGGLLVPDAFPSQWLLAFCAFMFISLAFAKRYTELAAAGDGKANARRGYRRDDLPLIGNVGPTAGFMALLVFSLFINAQQRAAAVAQTIGIDPPYEHPWVLWLVMPVMMFWVLRVWFLAYRGELHDDPIAFAIRDRLSYVCAAAVALFLLLAAG
ncbi:MAG: UbiA family prenyltransferase [Planctomycetota bacterium]